MFYCPRCKAAVPADALFCTSCGYNQTNARMAALPKSLPNPDKSPSSSNIPNIPPSQTLHPAQQPSQTSLQAPAHTPVPPVQPRTFRLSLPSTPRSMPQAASRAGIPEQPQQLQTEMPSPAEHQVTPLPVAPIMPPSLPNTPMTTGTSQNVHAASKVERRQSGTIHLSFYWLAVALMACVMLGLGAFIFSTYQTSTDASNSGNSSYTPNFAPPSLTAQNWQGIAIQQGSMLHLHGDNFDIGDPIIFLIDGSTSISGSNGRQVAIQVSNQGSFDVVVPVPTSWSTGPHIIEAEDNKTGQTAYLTIQVS